MGRKKPDFNSTNIFMVDVFDRETGKFVFSDVVDSWEKVKKIAERYGFKKLRKVEDIKSPEKIGEMYIARTRRFELNVRWL